MARFWGAFKWQLLLRLKFLQLMKSYLSGQFIVLWMKISQSDCLYKIANLVVDQKRVTMWHLRQRCGNANSRGFKKRLWYSWLQGFIRKISDIWFDWPVLVFSESSLQNHQQYVATRKTYNKKSNLWSTTRRDSLWARVSSLFVITILKWEESRIQSNFARDCTVKIMKVLGRFW